METVDRDCMFLSAKDPCNSYVETPGCARQFTHILLEETLFNPIKNEIISSVKIHNLCVL